MVKRYPHTVRVTTRAAATRDAGGNWLPQVAAETTVKGRWQAATTGALVTTPDGKQVAHTGTIYLPQGPAIRLGATVRVVAGDKEVATGIVRNSITTQVNRKLILTS